MSLEYEPSSEQLHISAKPDAPTQDSLAGNSKVLMVVTVRPPDPLTPTSDPLIPTSDPLIPHPQAGIITSGGREGKRGVSGAREASTEHRPRYPYALNHMP